METSLREPRPQKVAVVEEVRSRLGSAGAAILTEYRGLAVKDMEELRRALTKAGGDYKVYKNTLVRRAALEIGLDQLESLLEGPTAIAFVDGDVAAVAKVLRDFARTNPNLVVKGGLLGQNLIDAARTAALADLPSREVLLAQMAGILAAPLQRFAGLLQAVPQRVAYALSALLDERRANTPAAEAPAAAPAAAEAAAPADEAAAAADGAPAAAEDVAPATAEPEAVSTADEPAGEATTGDAPVVAEDAATDEAAADEPEAPAEAETTDDAQA